MNEIESQCELCKLPVEVQVFTLATQKGQLHFCCEGCLSVYKLLQTELSENSKDQE